MLRSNRRAAYTVVEARWRLKQLTELFEVSFDIRNCFFGQKQIRGALAGDIEDLRWALQKVKDASSTRPSTARCR